MNDSSLLVVFLCCFGQVASRNGLQVTQNHGNAVMLSKTFKALERLLDFFEENVRVVNLDGIFGLRIAEGVLESTFDALEDRQLASYTYISLRIHALKQKTALIVSHALPYLRTSSRKYFNQVGFVLENKWKVVRPFKKLSHPVLQVTEEDVMTKYGEALQPCMEALFGTGGSKPCNVTASCWENMTRPNNVGYTLTHQALYFMFGQQKGCSSILTAKLRESRIQGGIPHMYDTICSSMYPQMEILEKIKNKEIYQLDLSFEQAVVCGLLGFQDFLSKPRLRQLLKWQFPSGCYGDPSYYPNLNNPLRYRPPPTQRIRTTRTEKMLADGCESHISGVSSALLSIYIRWLALTQLSPSITPHNANEISN